MKCPKCGGEEGLRAVPAIPMPRDLPTYQLKCPCGNMWKDSILVRRRSYKESDKKWENVEFDRVGVDRREGV